MSIALSVNGPVIFENNNSTFINPNLDVESGEKVANVASEEIAPDKVNLQIGVDSSSMELDLPQTGRSLDTRIIPSTSSREMVFSGLGSSLASSTPSDENSSIDSSSRLPLGSVVEVIDPIDNCVRTIVIGSKKYDERLYRYVDSVPDPAYRLQYSESWSYGPPAKEQQYLEQLENFETRKKKGETLSYDAICMLEQELLKCQQEYDAVKFKYVEGLEKITRSAKWEGIFTRVRMLKVSFAPPKVEPSTPITNSAITTTTNRRSIAICCSALALVVITSVGLLINQHR